MVDNYIHNQRYQRQILLPGLGISGQQKLQDARVIVLGAGGLGCPALQYLAAAGVGTIGILDYDTIDISNLHRQLLFTPEDVGKLKVDCAREALTKQNPLIKVETFPVRLTNQNVLDILSQFDLIIDGTDNFATRYLVADASEILDIPLIYGAVSRFEGQIAVFNVTDDKQIRTSYRDLFPNPPNETEIPNCAEGGVLGVLPGIIGTMQASEAIKYITGLGDVLTNKMMIYQALNNQFYTISINPDSSRQVISQEEFLKTDYIQLCSANIAEISKKELNQLLSEQQAVLIDVRETHELPVIARPEVTRIPLSILKQKTEIDIPDGIIVTFCQSGKRSVAAAEILKKNLGKNKRIFSLKGGINELL